MNIWVVSHYAVPPSVGGIVRHYYFSKYLHEKNHQVRIFTSSKIHNSDINYIKDKSLYRELEVDEVEYTFVKSSDYSGNGFKRIANLIAFPFNIWKALRIFLKKELPDVIYTSSPDLFVSFFALIFARRKKIPVVLEVRDLWPESIVEYNDMSNKNLIIRILYKMEKWMYKKCDALIFTMQGGKDYIKEQGWDKIVDLSKIHHVNNGVDINEFDDNIKKWQLKDDDLNDDSRFKVVYVGSIRKANNVGALVDAARKLDEQGEKDIRIIIYGDGVEREELVEKCRELKLSNVIFKGRVNKQYIPYILSKSNLNILNYKKSNTWKYGGSQNKLFEYLASGRPICANVKMGYSVIENSQCGIEENIDSIERYVEIVKTYQEMPTFEYENQCQRARRAALKYDYSILTGKIEKVLRDVVDRGKE